jgi:probable phosphoglycerate mutase
VRTLYLVRHGENRANITKEFSHRLVDYELTERGRLQAIQTAEYFRTIPVDRIFSSPLKRAVETAAYISQAKGLKPEIVEGFRELNVGELERRAPDRESWGVYFKVTSDWYAGRMDSRFPGGEDYRELLDRFYGALREALADEAAKDIVVVGHGGIFTAGVLELCSIREREEFASRENGNCSISELRVPEGRGPLRAELVSWAYCGHLSGEAAKLTASLP